MKYAELHCHTVYSNLYKKTIESLTTPKQLIMEAKRKGLSAVAITDHNTMQGFNHAKDLARKLGIILIPAEEFNTNGRGQILGYGIKEGIKPGRSPEDIIKDIKACGGIAIIPHPFDIFRGMENIDSVVKSADGLEVTNFGALNNKKANEYASKNGVKIKTGGSDAHHKNLLGSVRLCFSDKNNKVQDYLQSLKLGDFNIETTRSFSAAIVIGVYNILLTRWAGFMRKKIIDLTIEDLTIDDEREFSLSLETSEAHQQP